MNNLRDIGATLKRVTQVLYSGLGGHASVAFSLVGGDRLQEWKHSFLFVGVESLESSYAKKSDDNEIPYIEVKSIRGKPWWSWLSIFSALRKLQPEAVVLHSVSSLVPVAAYCLFYRSKLIAVEHTPINLKSKSERFFSFLAFFIAKKIVLLTEAYKRNYFSSNKILKNSNKIKVISNGIDLSLYSKNSLEPQGSSFRVGMAARFSDKKRQDILVNAVANLLKEAPDVNISLTLAGDGECRPQIKNLIEQMGLKKKIFLPGKLDEKDLVEWMQSLDLYAHASDGEVLSTSMLQAMAMGLPILASNVPGIIELLSEGGGQYGLLVPENSPQAFALGIKRLFQDQYLRTHLSEVARRKVCMSYSQEAMFSAYNKLI